jgi:hypothetical protein
MEAGMSGTAIASAQAGGSAMKPKRPSRKPRREALVFSVVLTAVMASLLLVEHSPAAPEQVAATIVSVGLEWGAPVYAEDP